MLAWCLRKKNIMCFEISALFWDTFRQIHVVKTVFVAPYSRATFDLQYTWRFHYTTTFVPESSANWSFYLRWCTQLKCAEMTGMNMKCTLILSNSQHISLDPWSTVCYGVGASFHSTKKNKNKNIKNWNIGHLVQMHLVTLGTLSSPTGWGVTREWGGN